jgi:preprotein translocase subunit SecE
MEVVVNKKLKEVTFLNKLCDYITLIMGIFAIVVLASNMPNYLKLLGFLGTIAIGGCLFFYYGALGFQMKIFTIEAWKEVKKIAWPNRKETMQFTWIVFIFVAILSLILWSVDSIIGWFLYTFIIGR